MACIHVQIVIAGHQAHHEKLGLGNSRLQPSFMIVEHVLLMMQSSLAKRAADRNTVVASAAAHHFNDALLCDLQFYYCLHTQAVVWACKAAYAMQNMMVCGCDSP